MILFTADEVIALHSKLIEKTGGSHGLRDYALLESALLGAMASYNEMERYPSIEEKAARLAYALVSNHAFIDGNKRIGIYVMLLTLDLNNVKVIYTQQELISLGLGLADGSIKYEWVLEWIYRHEHMGETIN